MTNRTRTWTSRLREVQSRAGMRFEGRLTLLLMLLSIGPAFSQDKDILRAIQQTTVRVLKQAGPSVVAIARVRRDDPGPTATASPLVQVTPVAPDDPNFVPNDFGAGVLIRSGNAQHPKLILTNYHVVRGGPVFGENTSPKSDLWVTVAGGIRFQTSIVAADPHSDLAVLAVNTGKRDSLRVLLPKTYAPQKGQFVFKVDNPLAIARDGSSSAAWGIVGNLQRSPFRQSPDFDSEFSLFETVHHFGTLMQIGTTSPEGASGGAVLNMDGDLIGITTSLAPLKGYETSAGFAVPFTTGFRRVLAELTKGYEVEYGFLGVRPLDASVDDFEGLPVSERPTGGAVALSVTAGSPAAIDGIKPSDVIVAINGRSVGSTMDLMRDIALLGPNKKAKLRAWRPRDKRFVTKTVSLGKWPVRNDEDIIATAHRYAAWRGIRIDYATARAKYLRGGGTVEFEDAVVVVAVEEGKQGLEIQPGDFISHIGDQRIRTPAEFARAVRDAGDQAITLRMTDGREVEVTE